MKAKFLKFVQWWDTQYEEGKVYDLDDLIFARLLRAGSIEPVKETPEEVIEEKEVEQPEKPIVAESKPVVTSFKPLPKKPKGKKR